MKIEYVHMQECAFTYSDWSSMSIALTSMKGGVAENEAWNFF